jgi:hypothetical protein
MADRLGRGLARAEPYGAQRRRERIHLRRPQLGPPAGRFRAPRHLASFMSCGLRSFLLLRSSSLRLPPHAQRSRTGRSGRSCAASTERRSSSARVRCASIVKRRCVRARASRCAEAASGCGGTSPVRIRRLPAGAWTVTSTFVCTCEAPSGSWFRTHIGSRAAVSALADGERRADRHHLAQFQNVCVSQAHAAV